MDFRHTRLFRLFIIVLVSSFFSGCFEIVHYLDRDADNQLKVSWRFSLSNALSKGNGQGNKKAQLLQKLKQSKKELEKKFKGLVSKMEVHQTSDEFEMGIEVELGIKDMTKIPANSSLNEGFPLVPTYNRSLNQLTFIFLPSNKKKNQLQTLKQDNFYLAQFTDDLTDDSEEDGGDKQQINPPSPPSQSPKQSNPQHKSFENMAKGMQGMVAQIMSSASYKIMLGEGFMVESVHLEGITSGEEYKIGYKKYGSLTMIRIPYMSLLLKEKKGFQLMVQLKDEL